VSAAPTRRASRVVVPIVTSRLVLVVDRETTSLPGLAVPRSVLDRRDKLVR
jgi:hypothetical protein